MKAEKRPLFEGASCPFPGKSPQATRNHQLEHQFISLGRNSVNARGAPFCAVFLRNNGGKESLGNGISCGTRPGFQVINVAQIDLALVSARRKVNRLAQLLVSFKNFKRPLDFVSLTA